MKPVYTFRVLGLPVRILRFRNYAPLLILINLCCLLGPSHLQAEGTKQVMPNSANGTGLVVSTTSNFPLGNVGSFLGAPVDQRLYIHIKDFSTEKLYYGFNWETLAPGTPIVPYSDVYMRIYDPTGAQVGNPILLPNSNTTPSRGFISTWFQAIGAPNLSDTSNSGTYRPLIFNPSMNGDYYVVFYRGSNNGNTRLAGGESMLAKYFDLSVYSGTLRMNGRVHCNEWCFSVFNPSNNDIQDPATSTNATFFGYTPDSTTLQVSFPKAGGFQPLTYIVAFNNFGVVNGGNWLEDRRSIVLPKIQQTQPGLPPYLSGGFDVFLNKPDPTVYPPGIIPSPPILLAPVIAGCPPGPYDLRFLAPQPGDYYLLLDFNGLAGFQPNTADRFIEMPNCPAGVNDTLWDGKDGLGNIVPANTTFTINFSYRKGRINLPFYDVELNINGFNIDGVSPSVPGGQMANVRLYWDDTKITSLGNDCGDNNNNTTGVGYNNSIVGVQPVLLGSGTPPATKGPGRAWNGNGNPTSVVPAPAVNGNDKDNSQCNDYGNARLLNTWAWGITLDSQQPLTLTCVTVSGTVWDDADGSANGGFTNIRTNSEPGVNANATIYANLVDPVTNNVLYSIPVNADGTYTLLNCPVNTNGMKVYITTTQVANGNTVPSPAVGAGWLNTSPLIHVFNSGSSAPVTGVDFGIEQLPNSDDQNYTIATPILNFMMPLSGSGTIASPGPLHGSDPEDGFLGSNKNVVITSVPANEELYYNNVKVTNNFQINNYNPALLSVKFTTITVTSTSFTYAYLDAAGKQDPTPATYTINMSAVLATTLSSFSGRTSDYGNVLSWTSYNETPQVRFTIARSTDGVNFTPIGNVAANGNGTTVNHSFTDNSPTPNTSNYYRLEWTDGNGAIAYSNVVTIAAFAGSSVLDVSPNPFRSQVTVRLSLARTERVAIRLLDSKGMLLKQAQYQGVKGTNSFLVNDLGTLPASVYFVQIVLTDQVFVKKVFNQ